MLLSAPLSTPIEDVNTDAGSTLVDGGFVVVDPPAPDDTNPSAGLGVIGSFGGSISMDGSVVTASSGPVPIGGMSDGDPKEESTSCLFFRFFFASASYFPRSFFVLKFASYQVRISGFPVQLTHGTCCVGVDSSKPYCCNVRSGIKNFGTS